MKKKITLRLIVIFVMSIALFACEKDETDSTSEITRDDYVGVWAASETPQSKETWESVISLDPNSTNKIIVSKLGNLAGNTLVIVNGTNLTVPAQVVNDNTIEGTGKYQNSDLITWNYYVDDGADRKYYTSIYNRK